MWDLFRYFSPEVKQTGLIIEPLSPSDWRFSGATGSVPRDWSIFIPHEESQELTFDTMSCTAFSALNCIETQLKIATLPPLHKDFLERNGYVKNGEFNFSDKFTAILSGTSKIGNTFHNVGNSLRHDGIIPESLLPMGNETTWDEWHDPRQVSEGMKVLGKKFLEYFDIEYRYVLFNSDAILDGPERTLLEEALGFAPVQVAIPFPAHHAVMLTHLKHQKYTVFDTSSPYLRDIDKPIHFAMLITIAAKATPTPHERVLKTGSKGEDVIKVQKYLNQELWANLSLDGVFGSKTKQAVQIYQGACGLVSDGIVGKNTWKYINEKLEPIPVVNFSEPVDDIEGVNKYLMSLAQRVRTAVGFPMMVTSGKRTVAANERTGGVQKSAHLDGLALDIFLSPPKQKIVSQEFAKYGVKRFGFYKNHAHVDIDLSKPQTTWLG